MVIQNKSPASEYNGLAKDIKELARWVPPDMIKEIRNFCNRNLISSEIKECCPRCLKAHMLKKIRKIKSNTPIVDKIQEILDYETGHNGYYLDQEELIKII